MAPTGKQPAKQNRRSKTGGNRLFPDIRKQGNLKTKILQLLLKAVILFILSSLAGVALFRFVPVWFTPYIVAEKIRAIGSEEGATLHKKWIPYEQISKEMSLAVVAAEDQKFFKHSGFDFDELKKVMDSKAKTKRGASTITQQVAKNLFLWHGRSFVRKGLEAWFTVLIELIWPKERILEVYLNIAETGRMTFGVEAAAQRYFRVPAKKLTRSQSARIAAVLPNPKNYNAAKPGPYVRKRAAWIERQMRNIGRI